MTLWGTGLVIVAAALLAGCGEQSAPDSRQEVHPAARPTEVLAATGPVTTGRATVLDDGGGPELCLGGVADSLPPQCGGPVVRGWDWADHEGAYEEVGGMRWGEFTLVGNWDGRAFTPTEVVAGGDTPEPHVTEKTPCSEPAGGWTVVDPATTTQAARGRVMQVAAKSPDHGLVWVDQSINPRFDDYLAGDYSEGVIKALNDPALTIVNVGVTSDVATTESELRAIWGGPLCVYQVANTHTALREAAEGLRDLPGFLGGGYGSISNTVELTVVHDDGTIQRWVDQEYGPGVVEISSALQPASG